MRTDLLLGIALSFVAGIAFAGDLPTRYSPPPVLPTGPGTKVGVLNCSIAPSVGFIVAGIQQMSCRFSPDAPVPPEGYVGTLTTVGIDLGFTAGGTLVWGPFSRGRWRAPPA
jgi:hypothetical protein